MTLAPRTVACVFPIVHPAAASIMPVSCGTASPPWRKASPLHLEGLIDHVTLLAEDDRSSHRRPRSASKGIVESLKTPSSSLSLNAKEITLPSFKEEWLYLWRSAAPAGMAAKFKSGKKNTWSYDLAADSLRAATMEGCGLHRHSDSDGDNFQMDNFKGEVGVGTWRGIIPPRRRPDVHIEGAVGRHSL